MCTLCYSVLLNINIFPIIVTTIFMYRALIEIYVTMGFTRTRKIKKKQTVKAVRGRTTCSNKVQHKAMNSHEINGRILMKLCFKKTVKEVTQTAEHPLGREGKKTADIEKPFLWLP